ncbi:hypothetical protein LCGC14_3134540, partial [marine sediment metagenome]
MFWRHTPQGPPTKEGHLRAYVHGRLALAVEFATLGAYDRTERSGRAEVATDRL